MRDEHRVNRRTAIKVVSAGALAGGMVGRGVAAETDSAKDKGHVWSRMHDRVWLGGDYWANPMEDWCIRDGAAECLSVGGKRNVHSLTHEITGKEGAFSMSVRLERVAFGGKDGGAGLRIGTRSEINEYRSSCFTQNGLVAGIADGEMVLGPKTRPLPEKADPGDIELRLSGRSSGETATLVFELAMPESGEVLAKLDHQVPAESLLGNVSIISNFKGSPETRPGDAAEAAGSRYCFRDWKLEGDLFTVRPERRFGPILWSMYALSDSRSDEGFVLKLSVLTGPMGGRDEQEVELQVKRDGEWKTIGRERLDPDAWIATFRVANWEAGVATPFRAVYREKHRDGSVTPDIWKGTITANPSGRPLRMAAMTCQNDYGFPYEPVAENVAKLKPDIVFFSGDQIYESHGGFGFLRTPADLAILNYLRRFYQFGWAFREVMRDWPTLCLPDDHDVLQGNLWGEGGAKMKNVEKDPGASVLGGYVEPKRVVDVVHRTNVGHHPDPYDPTPVLQGIGTYYGDMVYGDVGFAILADRQWKSGPERGEVVVGKEYDRELPGKTFDKPGLVLLGERQEAFLKQWADDWRGHRLKAVLSQTLFASLATHQPRPDRYLKFDFDSNSWPQTARNRAVEIMRPSMALHICGDTHLATLSQYGVKAQRDSNWAFCTPAIAAGWPRWWLPDEAGMPHESRPKHGLPNTGGYLDAFENPVHVHAVGNPVIGKSPDRYEKAHEKGSGFGFITFDTQAKTYLVESFRFQIDASDGKAGNQFPGWPVTIHQAENRGENRIQ
ncbi:MAG: alkaline phosphatase D family protein [Verrucomicrobiota bacterium]